VFLILSFQDMPNILRSIESWVDLILDSIAFVVVHVSAA